MSDIEREEFEQAFLNQYTDFERFENGEYMDDFLQQSWIGWQASRRAISSCSEIPNSSDPDSRQTVSVPEWIKCSERLPKESDGDCHGIVWVYDKGLSWVEISGLEDVKFISDYTHWMPTNFVRPEPPKQEEGHE
jgi:hypothetical protein